VVTTNHGAIPVLLADLSMNRYFTADLVRLALTGLTAGSAAGIAWRAAKRRLWGGTPFVLSILVAARSAGRSDWFVWQAATVAAVLIGLSGARGAACLLRRPGYWPSVAAGALVSAAGVWAAVPETGPALLAAGCLTGLFATAAITRSRWGPQAGVGVAVLLAWAVLSGAAGRPWAVVGGALCAGVAPWLGLRPLLPSVSWGWTPGPWLLGVHAGLVLLASRWIGIVPNPGAGRVVTVAVVGLAVAVVTRQKA
jgi:hypothetical protein